MNNKNSKRLTSKDLYLKKEISLLTYSLYFLTFCLIFGLVTYSYLEFKLDYNQRSAIIISAFPFMIYLMSLPILLDKQEEIDEHNNMVKEFTIKSYISSKQFFLNPWRK